MNFGQSFRLAIKSLSTSKARAILTMLGIIIGVAAVIIIISLGDGMQNMVNEQFESVGTNLLMVSVFGRGSSRAVTDDDMFALAEKYPEYGFERNKGYGTAEHIAALKKYGPCPIHRMSFIGKILGEKQ